MTFSHFRWRHPWLWRLLVWMACLVAHVWRRLMFRTTFIAITGSVGRTTAKECLGAILNSRFPTVMPFDTQNRLHLLARTIVRTRYRHRFAVLEVAAEHPGDIWRGARLVGPDVAVILSVARTHSQSFPTLEDTAAEKAWLLDALRPAGIAILNGDDPRVLAMAARFRGRVVIFGRSPEFDLWASEVSSRWSARLSFRAHWGSESYWVDARLVGEHWLTSALASLAGAVCCGLDLKSAIAVLQQAEPHRARMEPVPLPSGAILLRDDFNGSPEVAAFVESELRQGDLALLRGRTTDHLGRIYFAQLGAVGCARARCPELLLCDHCQELRPGLEKAQAVPAPVRPFWQPLL